MNPVITEPLSHRPRTGPILIGAVLGFLAGQVVALLLELTGVHLTHFPGGLTALGRLSSPPWWSNVLGLVGLWIGFAGAVIFATTAGGLELPKRLWSVHVSDVKYVAIGVGAQFLVDVAYFPFHLRQLNKPVDHIFNAAHGGSFWLLIAMTTIGAPIMEELLFRGVIFRALRAGGGPGSRPGRVVTAATVSAGLFALAHAEPLQFIGLFFLGVILAVLVERTGRLTPSIVTHISFNTVAVITLIVHRGGH